MKQILQIYIKQGLQ